MHSKYLSPVHNLFSTWTLENSYNRVQPNGTEYPRRGNAEYGLEVYLSMDREDIDYGCSLIDRGFKVVLHAPDEWPLVHAQFYNIPPNTELALIVKPIITTTADNLREYSRDM
jgi:acid-sensing ion channel, other